MTDLKKLSADCEFGELKESLIKDRIIAGIRDNSVKSRLLREDALTLERCVKLCQAAEIAEKQLQTLKSEPGKIDAVRFVSNKNKQWQNQNETKNHVDAWTIKGTSQPLQHQEAGRIKTSGESGRQQLLEVWVHTHIQELPSLQQAV